MAMTYLEAARAVLQESGGALHSSEITRRALESGLIVPKGKTPEATMAAQLYLAVKRAERSGGEAPFKLVGGSTFELTARVASGRSGGRHRRSQLRSAGGTPCVPA